MIELEAIKPNSPLSVQGIITDESGNPLIGASVIESGTTNGTVTDFDGLFNLSLQSTSKQVEVSYTGYQSRILPVNGKKFVKVQLETGVTLDEAVIIEYEVPAVEEVQITSGQVAHKPRKERKKDLGEIPQGRK